MQTSYEIMMQTRDMSIVFPQRGTKIFGASFASAHAKHCETVRNHVTVRSPSVCLVGLLYAFALCDAHSALFGEAMPAVLSSGTRISESMRSYMISVNDLHACECPCTWFPTMVHLSLSLSLPNSILMVSHDSIVISCNISITILLLHPS